MRRRIRPIGALEIRFRLCYLVLGSTYIQLLRGDGAYQRKGKGGSDVKKDISRGCYTHLIVQGTLKWGKRNSNVERAPSGDDGMGGMQLHKETVASFCRLESVLFWLFLLLL